jgi:aspartate aminotransferase
MKPVAETAASGATPAIAHRSRNAPASPIRRLIPHADAARARGTHVYFLNIGQPDIETPPEMMDVLKTLDIKVVPYGPSMGLTEYRKALIGYYRRAVGIDLDIEDIMVTIAGSEAITFAMAVVTDPGDEVLIPEPMYANYLGFAAMLGITVVPITCRPEDGYHLPSREAIEAKITAKTKAILYCNPGNPSGVIFHRGELDLLADLARSRNLFLIADEVYREIVFDGEAISALTYADILDRVIMVDSISKRYSACGARIGAFVTKNRDVMAAALRYAQARLCPPTIEQLMAIRAVDLPDSYFARIVEEYRGRRDTVYDAMSAWPGVVCRKPGGAFYQMARLPVDDAETFIIWMLEEFTVNGATTMLSPAEGFYATPGVGRDEVRVACVLNRDDLARAMTIVEKGLAAYPGRR